ncbi:MAG: enterochelin esterase [Clostridia bacterium]|nr:enterochelin esterase [Clostridia bacterium]
MKEYSYHDVNLRGTIERVTYRTTNRQGEERNKYCLVYLPKGYDEKDCEKKYNILYLIHGGGGSPDAWLDCCQVKNMLDFCIDAGEIEPLIVVFPTFYKERIARLGPPVAEEERSHVLFFQKELAEELLPAIEGRYHTYARNGSQEALRASRQHRAIGGFSMGGATTWFAFTHHLDLFARFAPLSGDCWEVEAKGGGARPRETAAALRDAVAQFGYTPDDFRIFCATGAQDIACAPLSAQIDAMKQLPDTFRFQEDLTQGNAHYFVAEGKVHCYEHVYQYLYNILPYLFL